MPPPEPVPFEGGPITFDSGSPSAPTVGSLMFGRNDYGRIDRQLRIVIANDDRRRHDLIFGELGQRALGSLPFVAIAAAAAAARTLLGDLASACTG